MSTKEATLTSAHNVDAFRINMPNPDIQKYSVITVAVSNGADEHDLFIGRVNGELRLLRYRPAESRNVCEGYLNLTEDFGRVMLPPQRAELSDLIKGDIISIAGENGPCPFNGAIYQGPN